MEVAGNKRKPGAKVLLDACTVSSGQTWERRDADRTIRPVASPTLCLQPSAGSPALHATLEIATCATQAVAQQWTW